METIRLDEGLHQTVLPNGLTVLTEVLPGVRSVAAGVWVRTASAHEAPRKMGVSHLLEHMVFKGSSRRTARQLALELEARGGSLDAFTGRDHTNYQAHVLDLDLPHAIDVLTDLVRRPLLREDDLVLERNVVLEEIAQAADTPDDMVFELFHAQLWPDHPYGYSILGTPDTVGALETADLRQTHEGGYYPGNCVVAVAGQVDHGRLLDLLAREGWAEPAPPQPPRRPVDPAPAQRGILHRANRESVQAHVLMGSDTFPYRDPRRFALSIVTNTFGGGMSSRLFQRVREELGLAYSVYAYQQFFRSAGVVGVYLGTQPGTCEQALDAVRGEYNRLSAEGLSDDDLVAGRQQLKGQLMLSLESPVARMGRLAGVALHGEPYRPLDAILRDIDDVSRDQVAQVTAEFFAPDRQTIVQMGPQ